MISDVLSKAVEEIRTQLNNPAFGYTEDQRTRIDNLLKEMDAVRLLPGLDSPPVRSSVEVCNDAFISFFQTMLPRYEGQPSYTTLSVAFDKAVAGSFDPDEVFNYGDLKLLSPQDDRILRQRWDALKTAKAQLAKFQQVFGDTRPKT